MVKHYLIDGVVGFVAAFLLFWILPLLVFHGNWGLIGYDTVQSMFPSLANDPQGTLSVLCVVYVVFDCIMFLVYRESSFYKKRHGHGVEPFLFAIGSFLVGAVLGYGAVLFIGLLSLQAANGISL